MPKYSYPIQKSLKWGKNLQKEEYKCFLRAKVDMIDIGEGVIR
jgi:hypothetical protein